MTGLLEKAEMLATLAHFGQVDKAGAPYIEHPIRVAAMVEGIDAKIVALLHDTVEDTTVTLEQLGGIFPLHIVEAVEALTKVEGQTYMEAIEKAKKIPLAAIVKAADIEDHLGPGHEKVLTESMIKKYKKAQKVLTTTL